MTPGSSMNTTVSDNSIARPKAAERDWIGIATLAAAQAYPEFGGGAYLVGSAFALIGFCAVLTLRRLARRGERAHAASAAQPQSAGSGGNIIEPL